MLSFKNQLFFSINTIFMINISPLYTVAVARITTIKTTICTEHIPYTVHVTMIILHSNDHFLPVMYQFDLPTCTRYNTGDAFYFFFVWCSLSCLVFLFCYNLNNTWISWTWEWCRFSMYCHTNVCHCSTR